MEWVSYTEKLWVVGDTNGHCVRNNSGKEETIGSMVWVRAMKLETILWLLQESGEYIF